MGIPRFYRYMSERYPLINQPISDVSLLPEFDCFYLDMNGIIHNCTHTDAADGELSTLGLPAQLHNIFTYMDRLITHIIKPKKLVYIAIDGVAPRAKLNQQRSRRFRAGLEREEALKKERERHLQITLEDEKNGHRGGMPPAPTQRFDSNCITPGTEFLYNLSAHLVWFVRYKMKTDPLWARLEVYYSGSETPGEGEHKIVDFIRHQKMAPGYEPNVRHCMYGSDADLMLLGIMTHEPHFTLVREVVVWGSHTSSKVVAKKIAEEQWQLVHLSLFREYLMMEMRVTLPLDGERMLDDFILLTYLLGNDFIPHSPTLEISEDAIPLLMRVYRELLDKYAGQYLTENGQLINIPMLQDLFVTIGAMEEEILINRAAEEAHRRGKHSRGGEKVRSKQVEVVEDEVSNALALLNADDDDIDEDRMPGLLDDEDDDDDIGISDKEEELEKALDGEETVQLVHAIEEEDRKIFASLTGSASFQDTKWTYYERKFGIKRRDGNAHNKQLDQVKKSYMEALVWVLQYYFQGPPSWSWYYPYHYAPMISDLTDIEDVVKQVKFGTDPATDGPLLPFEQLMANLPSTSCHLVPEPYRFLMLSPLSPIKHFYPETFEIDMEGKRNAWEGVNILPFIDVALLKSAIAQYSPDSRLSPAERQRNKLQMLPLRITPDPQAFETVPSTLPGVPGFPDIIACGTRVAPYKLPDITANGGRFHSKLMDGVTLPMAGFPSLYTIPLESVRVEAIRLNCFGMASRKATLILKLPPSGSSEQAMNPQDLLGRTALVNWPNLHEAKVVGMSTLNGEFRINDATGRVVFSAHDNDKKVAWAKYAQSECFHLLSGRATPGSGGIDLGDRGISTVLHVLPLQGMISNPISGAVEKKFGQTEAVVPFQLAVVNRQLFDQRFEESGPLPLQERIPKDSVALITRGKWLGCTAKVQSSDDKTSKVKVHVSTIDKEPPFGYVIAQAISDTYFPGYNVAQKLGISSTCLGLLAGSVIIKPGAFDIGLNFRFRKDLLLPGFCRLVTKSGSSNGETETKNVWTRGDIVQIVGSGINLSGKKENDAKRSTNGNGGASTTTWEYTERAIAAIASYIAKFPAVIGALDKLPFATSYNGKQIFGVSDKAEIEMRAGEVMTWIDGLRLGKKEHAQHIPISSQYMPLNAMRAVEAAGMLRAKEREKHTEHELANPVVAEVFAGDLFRPNPLVNQDLTGSVVAESASKNPGPPRLGDRVINISAKGVPFGHRGTITATHVSSKCVEVLFDEGFTGGEPLYGSTSLDRGKIVPWNKVLCISSPPGQANPREREHQVPAAKPQRESHERGKLQQGQKTSEPPKVSTNYRKPRKTRDEEPGANATRILTPSMVASSAPSPVPAVAPAASVPAPPDPEKISKLIKKWSHQGQGAADDSVGASPQPQPARTPADKSLAPSVAALFNAAASNEPSASESIAPQVAALFTAAARQQEPSAVDKLAELFPHALNGGSGPSPPLPPPFMPMPPPPPTMHGVYAPAYPPAFPPGYPTPPPPPSAFYGAPEQQSVPQPQPPPPTPVTSMAEFPPLGSEPAKPAPGKKTTTQPAAAATTTPHESGEAQGDRKKVKARYVPKTDKSSSSAAAPKAPSLLLPAQVMRQSKPAQQ